MRMKPALDRCARLFPDRDLMKIISGGPAKKLAILLLLSLHPAGVA
jgi:hypothetical protein